MQLLCVSTSVMTRVVENMENGSVCVVGGKRDCDVDSHFCWIDLVDTASNSC